MIKEQKISDFTEVITGGTPSTRKKEYWEGGNIPWLNSGELNKKYIYESKNFITEIGLKNSSTKLMPPDTVLIALTGATCGLSALSKIEACANQSVTGILPSKFHVSEYVFHFLRTQRQRILDKAWGNAQPHISQAFVKEFKVPLPSIEQQTHIANTLNKAENLIAQRKESIRLLDEFLKSTFLEMFGDKKYEKIKLGEIIKIQSGQVNPNEHPYSEMYHVGGVNIESNTGKLINLKLVKNEHLISGKYLFSKDHILYSKIRPNLNKVATPDFSGICSADIYPVIADSRRLDKNYLKYTLMSVDFLGYALKHSDRTNIPKINRNALVNYPISLPSIELQNQFSKIAEKAENLKAQYQQSLQELENLYGSLSQRAFKGELAIKNSKENSTIVIDPIVESNEKKQSTISDKKKGFAKQVLGGKIVSLYNNDKNFTHIKFQKLQYLAEHIVEEELLWNYYRQAAGPHDNKFKFNVIAKLKDNKWFEERIYKFYPLQKVKDIDRYYKTYFGNKNDKLENLFSLLKPASEKFCEAIATIYAIWNNHIILQQPFDKSRIKTDFFDWSSRKEERFTEDEFEKALAWMQKHNIIPTGFGQLIKEKR